MMSVEDYENDIAEECPPEDMDIDLPPAAPTEGEDSTLIRYQQYRTAWKLGQEVGQKIRDRESAEKELYAEIEKVASQFQDHDEIRKKAKAAFEKGCACPRLLKDAPESVAKAIAWRRKNIGELRKRESERWITKSKNNILLSYMIYGLGHHGGTFPFAQRRISGIFANTQYKFSDRTVLNFVRWAEDRGYVDIVKEGRCGNVKTGGNGSPKILRIRADNLKDLIDTFGMDEKSKVPAFRGISFVDYIARTGLPFKFDTSHLQLRVNAAARFAI